MNCFFLCRFSFTRFPASSFCKDSIHILKTFWTKLRQYFLPVQDQSWDYAKFKKFIPNCHTDRYWKTWIVQIFNWSVILLAGYIILADVYCSVKRRKYKMSQHTLQSFKNYPFPWRGWESNTRGFIWLISTWMTTWSCRQDRLKSRDQSTNVI